MEDRVEDIDLSGTNIHNFLYNQGMRASRVREIYRLCVSNIIPQPTPFIFGDEVDRDRHALRRFRNALTMDLVPNVQYAYQQCGLRDDGQGMTPEELLEQVAEVRVDDPDISPRDDDDGYDDSGVGKCVEEGPGKPGSMEYYRDGEPDATSDPLHHCATRPRPVLKPQAKSISAPRKKPICSEGFAQNRRSESSTAHLRGGSRGCSTQTRRPSAKPLPNSQQSTSVIPAKPPRVQSALTSQQKSVSTQLTLNVRPTVHVNDAARMPKIQPPSPTPSTPRYSRTTPGRGQRPLSLPIGGPRAISAPVVDVPVRRWR